MYTLFYPSGRLFKDGVQIQIGEGNPDYDAYVDWLGEGNGPSFVPDPPVALPTVTLEQITAAITQFGLTDVTQDQLGNDIFNLARVL